ncbi:MAG: class I SAM-dependent methyltransferase [Alphaproteobacteria bacterium]|nr:class I SAM-dependent methyltransferase [Alphaproteobacteria bacterium]
MLAAAPAGAKGSSDYGAAVSDKARPDTDRQLDPERKPADMLALAHVRPGMKVMDLIPGRGYFTRLFAVAVGPKGYVYAYQPSDLDAVLKGKTPPINAVAANYPNVSVVHAPVNDLVAPEPLDLVWTSQNYHDLHDSFFAPADLAKVNKRVYDALKRGGLYIVLDHAAEKGSGLRDTDTLHRIDEAVVKKEVMAAGFKFAGESDVLRNPQDNRTLKVFDPAIRHKTDQFILVFRKP